MVALGGVIIDDVEHYLDAGVVQSRYRGAEGVERVVLRVARLRREIRQRIVTPVVRQFLFHQDPVVDETVDRQQLDGGNAKALEMLDHGGGKETHHRGPRHLVSELNLVRRAPAWR